MSSAQFGSIYPRKDPFLVLETAAELVRRGVDLRVVFIGSFVGDTVEADFWAEADRLGLRDRVEVTGYIQSAAVLYGVFAEVDAFALSTERRAHVTSRQRPGRGTVRPPRGRERP